MTCDINVRRYYLDSSLARFKSPRTWNRSRRSASRTCTRLAFKTPRTHALSLPLCAVAPHRVCIRDVKEAFSVRPRFPESFEYLVLDVQDSEEQNLIRLFPRFAWHFISLLISSSYIASFIERNNSLTPPFLGVVAFSFTVTVGFSSIKAALDLVLSLI
jgi:hypothetical protein